MCACLSKQYRPIKESVVLVCAGMPGRRKNSKSTESQVLRLIHMRCRELEQEMANEQTRPENATSPAVTLRATR